MYLLAARIKNRVRKYTGKALDTGVAPKKVEDLIEVEI
jgi:hypothetical protein